MPALGTEAVLPVAKAHTAAGAVMVQLGRALMVTSWLLEHWQPLSMVIEILAEAPDPAVQVIWVVLLPAVMVPPVMDQL